MAPVQVNGLAGHEQVMEVHPDQVPQWADPILKDDIRSIPVANRRLVGPGRDDLLKVTEAPLRRVTVVLGDKYIDRR